MPCETVESDPAVKRQGEKERERHQPAPRCGQLVEVRQSDPDVQYELRRVVDGCLRCSFYQKKGSVDAEAWPRKVDVLPEEAKEAGYRLPVDQGD